MAVRGENSPSFGKAKFNLSDFKFDPPKFQKIDFPGITSNIVTEEELSNRQIENQNKILKSLQRVTIEQSKTSKRQFLANLLLTMMTVVIPSIALIPLFTDQDNNRYKSLYEQTIILEKEKVEQGLIISELSKNLLDLQNQVKYLEIRNQENGKNID